MRNTETTECRMLKLALCEGTDVDSLNNAAALIRELPSVLRVRVDLDARQLEILHQHPAARLVQSIHLSLLLVGRDLTSLPTH